MQLQLAKPIRETIEGELNQAYRQGKKVTGVILTKEERHQLYASGLGAITTVYHPKFGWLPIIKAEEV